MTRGRPHETHLPGRPAPPRTENVPAPERWEDEASYRATFDRAPVGIAHVSLDGRWLRVNRRLCGKLGYSEAELLEKTFQDITYPDDLEAGLDNIRRLLAQEITDYSMEKRYIRKDGSLLWINLTVSLVLDAEGVPRHFIAAIQDISARKAAETALAESEARLRLFIERAPAAIAMFDTDMRYVAASRRFLRDYHIEEAVEAEALLGQSHYDVFPDIPQRWKEIHRRVLAGETLSADQDPFLRVNGRTDWVRWEMTPWYRADGSVGGALLFSRLVTARVEAQRRDRKLLELEVALREAANARDAVTAACAVLGQALGCAFVGIGEISPDGEHTLVESEWRAGDTPSVLGYHRMADAGADRIAPALRGEVVAVADVNADPRTAADAKARATYAACGARASLDVPLMRGDRPTAILFAAHAEPHAWTEAEIALARETVARAWQAVVRARAETALERTADEFRTLAEGIPTLCWMAEPDGRVYWYNRRWYEYTGTTPEQMQGWGWQTVHDPKVLPSVLERWRAAIASGTPIEMTFPMRGKDGVFRPFLTRAAPVRDEAGRVQRWLGINTDVSEAQQREESLRQSEMALQAKTRELESLLTSAPIGVAFFDREHRYLRVNQELADINGISISGHIGRTVAELLPANAPTVGPVIDQVFETGEPVSGLEVSGETPGEPGLLRHWLTGFYPVRDALGAVSAVGAWVVEITRLKRVEEALSVSEAELRRLNEGLEARVRAEVAAREATQDRLVQAEKLTALGQLAGGIAHDFNNVLQAVSGGASLIRRRAGDAAAIDRIAGMIEEAARRGASVTRRLLAFARRDELRSEPLDACALLAGLREVLAHTLGSSITILVDMAPGLPPVLADRGQLETVLINLATNARDAMPDGGTLTFSIQPHRVGGEKHIGGLAPGAYLQVVVTDTGVGMDATTLGRASEPFFTTKGQGKGTGLGLAMARGFAEQSGGALHIASEAGHGTTVTLWLPVATNAAALADPVQPGTGAPDTAGAPRVLLVDDEQMIRELLATHLADRGYQVVTSETGAAALELLEAGERVDLLVSDLTMPGMDGITLIRTVQARRPRMPAILLTGYAGDAASLAVSGAVSGTFSLLRKPVTPAHLADRVATLLEAVAVLD